MLKRWMTALIGIPITIGIWMISPMWRELPALMLILTVGLILNIEIALMVKDKKEFQYPIIWISICITLVSLLGYLYAMDLLEFYYFIIGHCIVFLATFYYILSKELLNSNDFSKNFEIIGFIFIAYITLVILFPSMMMIKLIYPNAWGLILLFAFCWISDAAGLFTGMAFGKHQLTILPSKSKTIEGYIGSITVSIFLGLILYYTQGFLHLPFQWSLQKWMLFGLCISLSSNFGDLTESLIKRWADKKDSSNFLPGMGGFFDAIDGQIYSTPIALLFFQ